jgi:tRNA pseudouridine55 synthase
MDRRNDSIIRSFKARGETPLQCLDRVRREQAIDASVPMTYAGRLDPLASGELLILVGDACKQKDALLNADKEYEIEVLFGVSTDTGDMLGVITAIAAPADGAHFFTHQGYQDYAAYVAAYVGRFTQSYPAYSSRPYQGKPLHAHARAGTLPQTMPSKEVEIYSIVTLGHRMLSGAAISREAVEAVASVQGDFRQEEIAASWQHFATRAGDALFPLVKLKVSCSSGTYMRALAERLGSDRGMPALAFSILRTRIGGLS